MSDTHHDKIMPIMGHLRELRNVLIKCAIVLVITTVISLAFTTPILQFLIAPYSAVSPSGAAFWKQSIQLKTLRPISVWR